MKINSTQRKDEIAWVTIGAVLVAGFAALWPDMRGELGVIAGGFVGWIAAQVREILIEK